MRSIHVSFWLILLASAGFFGWIEHSRAGWAHFRDDPVASVLVVLTGLSVWGLFYSFTVFAALILGKEAQR